jgi:hypothetical protein
MSHLRVAHRIAPALAALALIGTAMPASAAADVLVTTGSLQSPFVRNKQNEPGLAIDANNPSVLAAGANDEIDDEACAAGNPSTCPFTDGVGNSGIYFSFDGGQHWTQPTYSGWTARDCNGPAACTPHVGPIGTLPGYLEAGLVSDGDPSLAFGPKPGSDGKFSWANGSRLYYANLTSNFSSTRSEETFNGFEAIAVSRTDNVTAAADNVQSAWMAPVIVSRQNSALFSDHEQVWADNASSSPFFGNVYICFAAFRGQENGNAAPAPIKLARSIDGGDTWTERQLSAATNNSQSTGRQDCGVRTDSKGTVYVFWQGGAPIQGGSGFVNTIFVARSFDGGQNFEKPRGIATFTECGLPDPVQGRTSFDGIAGARTGSFPSLDIANGAPTGTGATDEVVATWCDGGPTRGTTEHAVVTWSTDRGDTYSSLKTASPATDRTDFPAIGISPTGSDVYLVYDNFLKPFQTTTANSRPMQGVVRHATTTSNGTVGDFTDLHRGAVGDARASSANALTDEFLGDYNNVFATRTYVMAVFNDTSSALDCPAIDTYRQSLTTSTPLPKPAPNTACPATFGNTDIRGFTSAP